MKNKHDDSLLLIDFCVLIFPNQWLTSLTNPQVDRLRVHSQHFAALDSAWVRRVPVPVVQGQPSPHPDAAGAQRPVPELWVSHMVGQIIMAKVN